MKTRILSTLALSSIILASCGNTEQKESEHETTTEPIEVAAAELYTVNTAESAVTWKGEVAGVYGHTGNVGLKSGTITITGNQITGGEFVIDMASIVPTDSASYQDKDGHRITDLQGHLIHISE